MSHEKTADEVRDEFLDHCADMVEHWLNEARRETCREKMIGLVHSILVTLDGDAADLPAFVVAPAPHPDDKQYHQDERADWYPETPEVDCDIAGVLQNNWYPALVRMGLAVAEERSGHRVYKLTAPRGEPK